MPEEDSKKWTVSELQLLTFFMGLYNFVLVVVWGTYLWNGSNSVQLAILTGGAPVILGILYYYKNKKRW